MTRDKACVTSPRAGSNAESTTSSVVTRTKGRTEKLGYPPPHHPISSGTRIYQSSFKLVVHIENRNLNPPARFGADYCGFEQPFANNESAAVCTAVPLKKSRFPEVQNSTALVKTMSRKASSLMTPCSTSS